MEKRRAIKKRRTDAGMNATVTEWPAPAGTEATCPPLKVVECSAYVTPEEVREGIFAAYKSRKMIIERMTAVDREREYLDMCLLEQDLRIQLFMTGSPVVMQELKDVMARIKAMRPRGAGV